MPYEPSSRARPREDQVGRSSDDGRLTLSLRLGEEAVVETPDGDVRVKCVRASEPKGMRLSIQVIAPRSFNIRRS